MSIHVYHELYAHLVWHAKSSRPILVPPLEEEVHAFIQNRCRVLKGVFFHGIGGTDNHLHMTLNYTPDWSVSQLVKDLKGSSAFELNKAHGSKILEWQRGYGVVSFGRRNLPTILQYIEQQKKHHSHGTIHDRLERITRDEEEELEGKIGSGVELE